MGDCFDAKLLFVRIIQKILLSHLQELHYSGKVSYKFRSVFELQKFYYMKNSSEFNQEFNTTLRFSVTTSKKP